jgi:hypothetical protein
MSNENGYPSHTEAGFEYVAFTLTDPKSMFPTIFFGGKIKFAILYENMVDKKLIVKALASDAELLN